MVEKERWKNGRNVPEDNKNIIETNENTDTNLIDDDVEIQLEEAGIIRAPDGGYGWVVVFASFIANMVVDGVIFSISETIVPLWEKEFNTTTSMATVATSLLAGCYLLSGPLGSALANSFGCNTVAIVGSIIATSGLLISVLVPALPVLYFTFGIIGGIGYGLIYLPAVVIVGQYFSEKRALATGIAVCGSGIGTSLFSYLNPIILQLSNNNWRIFLVVIAGITLTCVLVGYFFKPLKPSSSQIKEVTKITTEYIDRHNSLSKEKNYNTPVTYSAKLSALSKEKIETTTSPHVTQGVAIERFEQSSSNQDNFLTDKTRLHSSSRTDLAGEVTKASMTDLNRPLSKMDIFYTGSISSLAAKDKLSNSTRKRATSSAVATGTLANTSLETTSKSVLYLSTVGLPGMNDNYESSSKWTQNIAASLRSLLDTSLLKSPSYMVLALSGFLTLACFFVPFMFIGALAKQNGVDESLSKYIVVILGLVNLAGRIICGLISDHPMVDPLVISNIAVILGGLATVLVPFGTEFWMFVLYCIPFALGVACFAALRSIICVELLGIEKLTNAYGMLMLFMGIAALIGPPFAAWLKNLTNSFNMSFHVMGGLMILSGIISLPLRAVSAYETKINDRSSKKNSVSVHELEPLRSLL